MANFIKDVVEIRQRAMRKIEDGAVTEGYKLDKDRAVEILNEALATEIVCVLRYMHHYFMATGVHGKTVADEFREHADEERAHADLIGERIQQLGGSPDFNPGTLLQRSVAQYIEGETLADMIKEDLIAERTVIEVYQRMIEFFGNADPTTRRMLEHIKEEEEEHASDLSDMLYVVDARTGKTEGRDPGTDPMSIKTTSAGRSEHQRSQQTPGSDFQEHDDSANDAMEEIARTRTGNGGGGGGGTLPRNTRTPGESEASRAEESREASQNKQQTTRTRALDVSAAPRAQGGEKQPGQPQGRSNMALNDGIGNMARNQPSPRETRRDEPSRSQSKGDTRTANDRGSSKTSGFTPRGIEIPGRNVGGVSGRPMNRRKANDEEDTRDVAQRENAGSSSGTNRTPKILQKNRKNKRAA